MKMAVSQIIERIKRFLSEIVEEETRALNMFYRGYA